jgi:hypothetical protein
MHCSTRSLLASDTVAHDRSCAMRMSVLDCHLTADAVAHGLCAMQEILLDRCLTVNIVAHGH